MSGATQMPTFESGRDVALTLRPDEPVYGFRPNVLRQEARAFLDAFPGKTAYAVKTNGEPFVLRTLVEAGVSAFDVASPAEFEAVRDVSCDAEMLYMHPVKAPSAIRLALDAHRIRSLAVDHEDEVAKVLRVVRALDLDPEEITLFVRLRTKGQAAYDLSRKFGAAPGHAVELVRRVHRIGFRVGLCFHVGSQIQDATTYTRALATADWVRGRASVPLTALDVGGGFPAPYGREPGEKGPPPIETDAVLAGLRDGLREWGFDDIPLVAEPGRAIVARSLSVVVRVLLRKGRRLYINDGIWSSLSDSWTGKLTLPARLVTDPERPSHRRTDGRQTAFKVCGTTCDSVDILSRPFWLPEHVATGDWIEIGHIGAYSMSLRTRFNGFYPDRVVEVEEPFSIAEADGRAAMETMA